MFSLENIHFYEGQQTGADLFHRLREEGQILYGDPAGEPEPRMFCFKTGRRYWIWWEDYWGVAFTADSRDILIYPWKKVQRQVMVNKVIAHWLPYMYQIWGYHVLHSSAVYDDAGQVIAFCGPTGSGKSTLSFAVGQRPGWGQLGDDSIAVTTTGSSIQLVEMPGLVRLRHKSARHFQESPYSHERIHWPDKQLTLAKIYFLEDPQDSQVSQIRPISKSNAYRNLLLQSYVFSEYLKELNHSLMRDMLQVAGLVPSAELAYKKDFAHLGHTLELIISDFQRTRKQSD